MAINVTKYERRDEASREALGEAALELCRRQRQVPGISDSRFFWTSADGVAVFTEAQSPQAFDEAPKPELAAAVFALGDLARQTRNERWIDPRDGMSAHQTAGR